MRLPLYDAPDAGGGVVAGLDGPTGGLDGGDCCRGGAGDGDVDGGAEVDRVLIIIWLVARLGWGRMSAWMWREGKEVKLSYPCEQLDAIFDAVC